MDGTISTAHLQRSLLYSRAANYVAQAAAGLRHAHGKGFVHRDIKPANLILAGDGIVKVLDMGLARSVCNPRDSLTSTLGEDVIVGTADFLSPEQALNADLDARSDIYSLGATFFALLTGRAPFQGSTAQKVAQHQLAATPDVSKLRPDVSPAMAAVVTRMMAKLPRDRYQSAREVIVALSPWLPVDMPSEITVVLRSADTTEVGTGGGPRAPRTKLQLLSRVARRAAWCAPVLAAGLLYAVLGGAKSAHPQVIGGEPEPQFPLPAEPQLLTGHSSAVNDIVLSPDGTRCASVDWDGKLFIWDAKTGARLHNPPTRPGARGLVCATTPDGRYLLVAGERMPILAFDWATGREVRVYPPHEKATWGIAVSPGCEHLLTSGADGAVVLRDLATGDEIRRFEFAAKLVWTVAFSPDGTKFAAGCGEGPVPEESNVIKVWATADGKELNRLTGHTSEVRAIEFRPDGQALASGGFDGTIRLWNLTTGTEIRTIDAHESIVERVRFLPDGRRVLTCGGPMQDVRPNGEGGTVKIWDTVTGRELTCWRGGPWSDLISIVPSRDGRSAVAGGRDKNVRLWSLPPEPTDPLAYTFQLPPSTVLKSTFRDGGHSDPRALDLFGKGIYLHCWKKESVAEFRCDVTEGRPWIGVTNLNADVSSQVLFQFDEGLNLPVVAGKRYRVRVEYRTTNDAQGAVQVRNPRGSEYPTLTEVQLGGTNGTWKTVEMTFQRPAGGTVDVCVLNSAVGEGNQLAVRTVEVFEADPVK
uniref:Protein kinase domain-containing protein n=1 Tax=Gemmata sp. Wa1-1 TaxID=235140 RepID=Q5EUJ2_9BACT|nr:unknown [Gemmata sp. Wa1-1]